MGVVDRTGSSARLSCLAWPRRQPLRVKTPAKRPTRAARPPAGKRPMSSSVQPPCSGVGERARLWQSGPARPGPGGSKSRPTGVQSDRRRARHEPSRSSRRSAGDRSDSSPASPRAAGDERCRAEPGRPKADQALASGPRPPSAPVIAIVSRLGFGFSASSAATLLRKSPGTLGGEERLMTGLGRGD